MPFNKNIRNLTVRDITTLNELRLTRDTIRQTTSITSGVTIDSPAGFVITTTSGNISTNANAAFTVTNPLVSSDSLVFTNIISYNGVGSPVCTVNNVTDGSFQISLRNVSDTNQMTSGSMTIAYSIM
jgi:hypothetical protein